MMPVSTADARPCPPPGADGDGRALVCLWNGALDSGNLGVQALGLATVAGIRRRLPGARIVVFGNREGVHRCPAPGGMGGEPIECVGASLSRKPWKRGNLYAEGAKLRLGLGARSGLVSRCLSESDLTLDISGGDSFTTLYGAHRYNYVTLPKRLSLRFEAPLVLLPQTYGPFDARREPDARSLLGGAAQVWARDEQSRGLAAGYLGGGGVGLSHDVAFALPYDPGTGPLRVDTSPVVGVNVSGLLFNGDQAEASRRFGIRGSYASLMARLVEEMLSAERTAHVVLVPHVVVAEGNPESDVAASKSLVGMLPPGLGGRVSIAAAPRSACEAKGLIRQCDFFVGARMHACIAALSSGVPACAVAYSDKTAGVFGSVGVADWVLDPRAADERAVVDGVLARLRSREEGGRVLAERLPDAVRSVDRMFDQVASLVPIPCP